MQSFALFELCRHFKPQCITITTHKVLTRSYTAKRLYFNNCHYRCHTFKWCFWCTKSLIVRFHFTILFISCNQTEASSSNVLENHHQLWWILFTVIIVIVAKLGSIRTLIILSPKHTCRTPPSYIYTYLIDFNTQLCGSYSISSDAGCSQSVNDTSADFAPTTSDFWLHQLWSFQYHHSTTIKSLLTSLVARAQSTCTRIYHCLSWLWRRWSRLSKGWCNNNYTRRRCQKDEIQNAYSTAIRPGAFRSLEVLAVICGRLGSEIFGAVVGFWYSGANIHHLLLTYLQLSILITVLSSKSSNFEGVQKEEALISYYNQRKRTSTNEPDGHRNLLTFADTYLRSEAERESWDVDLSMILRTLIG